MEDLGLNDVFPKVQDNLGLLEEIETEKSFNRALGRKIVADDGKFLGLKPKTREFWDCDNRRDDCAASSGDFGSRQRMSWVHPHTQCRFIGNNSPRGTCINGQFKKNAFTLSSNLGTAQEKAFLGGKFEPCHRFLEGGNVTFWQRIFRIFHKGGPFSFLQGKEFSVDLVTMGTMDEESAGQGGGGRIIDLIDSDQKPFPMESLFNRFNFLRHSSNLVTSIRT